MPELATYELLDHVAVVTLDDGKANAFSPDMIASVNGLLDRAEDEANGPSCCTGRAGLFSGGFWTCPRHSRRRSGSGA